MFKQRTTRTGRLKYAESMSKNRNAAGRNWRKPCCPGLELPTALGGSQHVTILPEKLQAEGDLGSAVKYIHNPPLWSTDQPQDSKCFLHCSHISRADTQATSPTLSGFEGSPGEKFQSIPILSTWSHCNANVCAAETKFLSRGWGTWRRKCYFICHKNAQDSVTTQMTTV